MSTSRLSLLSLCSSKEFHFCGSFWCFGQTTLLSEFRCDFLKGLSFGLWNFEKCKQSKGQDQSSEEEKHIRSTEVLQTEQTQSPS